MIRLQGVCRTFTLGDSEVRALSEVSLAIEAGEYLSVMGPSGSGKSTLLNVLGLLDRPDRGEYLLDGSPTAHRPEEERARLRRERVGFVFQSYHLIPRLSARENIELPLLLAARAPRERTRVVDEILERLSLTDRAHHLPSQLSGGQRQRVAIGRSMVMRPGLLLADEPTGNLDTRSGAEVSALLEELNAGGITLLVVTHDEALGARARRRLRMRDGAVVLDTREAASRAPA
jgi:putative ABC transport system ATP-binding protein